MTWLDYIVLFGTMLGIAGYGVWRTRGTRTLQGYLRGDQTAGWATIGLSVMATQASAITFLSTPGQGYESGLGFVQNYFGLPFALIIIAAVFLPIYRRLNVYTAYEYLGRRFDGKTRLLGAALFLLQRGLAAGVTIYAPAIVLSSVLGWRLDPTILLSGIVVIIYTVAGGSEAVSQTQKWQMAVIFGGMVAAFIVLWCRLPAALSATDTFRVAADLGKLHAVDFSTDPSRRYTFWSGLFGGVFLSLSYFGTDQSQVQRYLGGASLRESRLGLMFNAVAKIPMQFFILLLGALLFVFYQFERPPIFFNTPVWQSHAAAADGAPLRNIETRYNAAHAEKAAALGAWLNARRAGDTAATAAAQQRVDETQRASEALRDQAKAALHQVDPATPTKDSDYVFITFVLHYLPHGLIGLLIAVIFAATLSSKAAELNALGTTTTVDIYCHLRRLPSGDRHDVRVSRWFTAGWGVIALSFALLARFAENLIEAVNILGSIFYGVVLGMFLVAFFLKRVGGTALFWSALLAQILVLVGFFELSIGYLWYNLIGCALCVIFSVVLQLFLPRAPVPADAIVA